MKYKYHLNYFLFMEESNNEIIFMSIEDKKLKVKANNCKIDQTIRNIKKWINEDSNVQKYKEKKSNNLPNGIDIMLHKEVTDVLKILTNINSL